MNIKVIEYGMSIYDKLIKDLYESDSNQVSMRVPDREVRLAINHIIKFNQEKNSDFQLVKWSWDGDVLICENNNLSEDELIAFLMQNKEPLALVQKHLAFLKHIAPHIPKLKELMSVEHKFYDVRKRMGQYYVDNPDKFVDMLKVKAPYFAEHVDEFEDLLHSMTEYRIEQFERAYSEAQKKRGDQNGNNY